MKISHFTPFQVLTHNHHVQDGDGADQVFIVEEVEIFFVFFDFNFCNFTFSLRSLPLSSDPELHLPSSSSLLWERSGKFANPENLTFFCLKNYKVCTHRSNYIFADENPENKIRFNSPSYIASESIFLKSGRLSNVVWRFNVVYYYTFYFITDLFFFSVNCCECVLISFTSDLLLYIYIN